MSAMLRKLKVRVMAKPKLSGKKWSMKFEKELFDKWVEEKLYDFNIDSKKEIYSIDNPPPYPSGDIHPGQLAHYIMIDMIARTQRMKGYEVLYPLGLDRNGINIEQTVERKTNKSIHDFDREEFIELCKKEIDKISHEIVEIFKRTGLSCYYKNAYETDSPEYRGASQSAFIELWNKGLIFEDYRPNNYCPGCKTTIAEAEIEYEEVPTKMNYVLFKVKETGKELEIGTTRPELICACQAVLVNPNDERYKDLHGKQIIIPTYNRAVPIKPHPYAKPEFGTGVVMVCSYGDTADVQIFRELKLKPIIALDENAKITEAAGKELKGLGVKEAREKMIEILKKKKLLTRQEDVVHRTPVCERSKDHLEFISLKEWYVKQLDFLDDLRKITNQMKFYPEKNKQILLNWISSITIDWPISRRRYYHTEIPLWYCKKCNKALVPEPGKYYQPWKEKAPFDKCPECGGKEFRGEERVFDTWMDSSISNLYVCGYKKDEKLFEKTYPTSMRPQGREIVRTWLYYSLLKNKQLLNKPAFKNVWISGLGMDEHGKKMSKSKGNYIEAMPLVEKYSAEAYRFWAAGETNVGDDFRISENRISGASKFLTKFWNMSRFISSFELAESGELKNTDRWILAELNDLIKECRKGYDELNFFIPANRVREFVWNILAPQYIEIVKCRAYEGDSGALYTLHTCLKTVSELLAPICPFITDKIYRELYGKSVHKEMLPEINENWESNLKELTEKIIEFNSKVWKMKKAKGIPLNAEIKDVKIPSELKPFEEDLIKMHKIT